MAGIYIHIPYCKQKCSYCNFYFSVSLKTKEEFILSLLKEIEMNHDFLGDNIVKTIYFGGGTPSLLSIEELEKIINKLSKYFVFDKKIEITLEANPDDISTDYLKNVKKIGITRFSLGVQSFHDEELKILNRSHNANKSIHAIEMINNEGFNSTNIDLIFSIPGSTMKDWERNLEIADDLKIPHLSCYNLTIEDKTAISYQIKTGKLPAIDEKTGAEMFLFAHEFLIGKGYDHYEISNYAMKGNMAIHNTNYWRGKKYLGFGPSAHSFDGDSRQWNIANVRKYIQSIQAGIIPSQGEVLTGRDKYNEYIMTGLRTKWGVDIKELATLGTEYIYYFETNVKKYIESGLVLKFFEKYLLSTKGMLYADKIASELFVV